MGVNAPVAPRPTVALAVATIGVVVLSVTVNAHDPVETGGPPVALALVVLLPVAAGLVGGVVAVRYRQPTHSVHDGWRKRLGLGVLVVALGVAMVLTAGQMDRTVALAGGVVGTATAVWVSNRTSSERPHEATEHARLTLGSVGIHRLVEGAVVGGLYSTGVAVGLAGAIALAGHTALETVAVGGLYASRRIAAGGAVAAVQLCYAAGVGAGLVVVSALPDVFQAVLLALAGGILLWTGVAETKRSISAWNRRDSRPRSDADSGPRR